MKDMKKYTLILSAVILLPATAACSREEAVDAGLVQGEITAASGGSKTVLSGKNVSWSAGDAISVFTDAGTVHQFVTAAGGATATFTGTMSHFTTKVNTLYPYDAAATFADGSFTTALASEQTAVKDGFADDLAIMTASGNVTSDYKCSLSFKQACALVKVTATSDVSFIELVAPAGTLLAGRAKVDPSLGAPVAVSAQSSIVLGSGEDGNLAAGDYNFTVFPFQADGCKVVYHIGTRTKTRTLNISVARAAVFPVEGSDADLPFDAYQKTVKVNGTALTQTKTDIFEGEVSMTAVSTFNITVDDVPYGFLSYSGAGGLGKCNSDYSALPWYNRASAQTAKSSVDYYTGRATGAMVKNGGNKFYTNLSADSKVYFKIDLTGETPIYYMELVKAADSSVVFHEDFDLCVCGGDFAIVLAGTSLDATKTGYEGGKKSGNTANQPGTTFDYPYVVDPADGTKAASDSYIASRGLTGWEFKYAGERPGALQLCSGGISGYMITPAFSSLTGATDVTVAIEIERFATNSVDPIKVILLGGGTFTDGSVSVEAYAAASRGAASKLYSAIGSDTFSIADDEYCPHSLGNNDKDKPHSYFTLHATGVTAATKLKIDAKKAGSNAPRCFVFDIKVTK